MNDSPKEKRKALIEAHKEKFAKTTIQERRESERRVLEFWSHFDKNIDVGSIKKERILHK